MWSIFSKTYGFVIQVILVIAAVLLFSYLDPFGLLTPSKLKLKDTPISVESIQDIGELITAEYYGEVVNSYKGVLNERTEEEYKEVEAQYLNLHETFSDAIEEFADQKLRSKRKKKVYEAFSALNDNLVSDGMFASYLYYLKQVIEHGTYKKRHLDKAMKPAGIRRFIKDLWLVLSDEEKESGYWKKSNLLKVFDNELSIAKYKKIYYEFGEKEREKKINKNRLVLLGRGWVKAGYNFEKFTNENFKYNADAGRIDLLGMKAEILSKAINPWFIPEKNVPGFEILIAKRKARRSTDVMLEVKRDCLAKLVSNAERSGILKAAKENAIENLEAFFSLIMEKDIKVFIHETFMDYTLNVIEADKVFTELDVVSADLAIVDLAKTQNLETLTKCRNFVDTLRQLDLQSEDENTTIQRFQAKMFEIAEDGILTEKEIILLRSYRNKVFGSKVDSSITFSKKDLSQLLERLKLEEIDTIQYQLSPEDKRELNLVANQSNFMDLVWEEEVINSTTKRLFNTILASKPEKEDKLDAINAMLRKDYTLDKTSVLTLHRQLLEARLVDYTSALNILKNKNLDIRLRVKEKTTNKKVATKFIKVDISDSELWTVVSSHFEGVKLDYIKAYNEEMMILLVTELKKRFAKEASERLKEIKREGSKSKGEDIAEITEEASNLNKPTDKTEISQSKQAEQNLEAAQGEDGDEQKKNKGFGSWIKKKASALAFWKKD